MVLVLVGAVLASGCGSSQHADPASAARDPDLQRTVRAVVGAHIHVPAGAVDVVASNGAAWVAGFGAVSRLDPETGRVVARIRTPDTGDYSHLAVGQHSVWVTGAGKGVVYRIDPVTNRVVATVHVGGPVQGIAVGGGRVWVTRSLQGPGDLIGIDPQTNRVIGPVIKVGPGPVQVTYGEGAVWVQNTSPRSVMRVDPRTGHVSTVIGVVPVAYGSFVVGAIAVGDGSLWSAVNNTLTRVDARSGQVVARVRIPRAQAIAIGAGEVWVLAAPRSRSPTLFYPMKHTAAVWEVDPRRNRIAGGPIRLDGGIAITASQRTVWVAHYNGATITRLRRIAGTHRARRSLAARDHEPTSGRRRACVWRAVPSADPRPRLVDGFDSVAAVSRREAWAVGDYYTGQEAGPQGAFVERWNGQRWRVAATAIPHNATPRSVSASGARDAWVVGQRDNGAQLIEHWNGSRWRSAPAPPVRRSDLFAVAARSPSDPWAVGVRGNGVVRTLIEHWDGSRWRVIPSPSPAAAPGRPSFAGLQAVTAISATDAWAAGTSGGTARSPAVRTLIEHWNGTRWTIVPSPNVRAPNGVIDDWLFSISGSRPDDVWAVGSWGSEPRGYGGTGDHALALHWDGRSWSHISTPAIARGSVLFGVVARGDRAWAVGSRRAQADAQTLIEHWDGAHWTTVPTPRGLWLKSVATSRTGPAWAVGENRRQPLAARC